MKNILQSIRRWDMQQFDLDRLKQKLIDDRNQDIDLLQKISNVKDNEELQEVLEKLVNLNIKKANKLDQLKQDIKNVEMSEAERRKTDKELEYERKINEMKEQLDLYYSYNEEIQMKIEENIELQRRSEMIASEKERLKNYINQQDRQVQERYEELRVNEQRLQEMICQYEELINQLQIAEREYHKKQQDLSAKYVSPNKSKRNVETIQEEANEREDELPSGQNYVSFRSVEKQSQQQQQQQQY